MKSNHSPFFQMPLEVKKFAPISFACQPEVLSHSKWIRPHSIMIIANFVEFYGSNVNIMDKCLYELNSTCTHTETDASGSPLIYASVALCLFSLIFFFTWWARACWFIVNTGVLQLVERGWLLGQMQFKYWVPQPRLFISGLKILIIIIRIFTQDNPSVLCTAINGVLHIELK